MVGTVAIDVAWVVGSAIGMVMAFMDSRYLATFVWFAFGMYALSNYFDRKLRGKYDV